MPIRPRRSIPSRWLPLAGAAATLATGAAALHFFTASAQAQQEPPRAAAPQAAASAPGLALSAEQWSTLTLATVAPHGFDALLTADGAIATNDNTTALVYSQFSGRVMKIYAQPGEHVRKGAPLLALLSPEAAQARSDIAAAAAALATADDQLALAQRTEARQQALLQAEAGTEKDLLQSQADRASAQHVQRSAQVALAAAQAKSAVLADARGDDRNPGQALVTSPIDGTVVQRQVAPGQFLNSLASGGSAPLYTVSDLRSVWVQAAVGEADAARLRVGQPVDVKAWSQPGRSWRARVTWVAAAVDPATHRVAFRAELPNADLALRPQAGVTVRVLDAAPQPVLAVPRGAVIYEGADAHCYVVGPQHTLLARPVQIGRIDGELAEVTAGLRAGEQVVARGSLFIDRASESVAQGDAK